MPTLGDAFEDYMAANPNRSKRTDELYRYEAKRYLGDWLSRPLDAIARRDVEARFNRITEDRLVACQPRDVPAALGLPPALRRSRGPTQSGRSMARRRRQVSSQSAAQDLDPRRGAAVLARRAMSRTHIISMGGSRKPAVPSSGSTACAIVSLPSLSAS